MAEDESRPYPIHEIPAEVLGALVKDVAFRTRVLADGADVKGLLHERGFHISEDGLGQLQSAIDHVNRAGSEAAYPLPVGDMTTAAAS